ncbi:UNVERIFIED_CONTAM: hypothetical protein Slati_4242700 [Sesamum latifolium]|uniref:Uncharacterized protein n=1 Tax=Sesamum latifolium TaxID=2727402 RepID=A0AAW2TC44_9LAMI
MDYCKFCGEVRYKPTREQNPSFKKTPYAILRYLPLTPRLQRLYASEATAEHMTWHTNHQTKEGSMCHLSGAEAFCPNISQFYSRPIMLDWVWRHFNPAQRIIDGSRWIEVTYHLKKAIPTPKVATVNQTCDLYDPNGIQLVVDLSVTHQSGAGTSCLANDESDDEDDEHGKDSFEGYETE